MSEPITIQDVIIAKMVMGGKNCGQIIDIFKEKGIDITRQDIRRGTELTFWLNIPGAIEWNNE